MDTLTFTPLGHATVLIELGSLRIITDPVFSERVGFKLGPWIFGPKRTIPPAIHLKELPPIDVILLSHSHYDHTDAPSLKKLPKESIAIVQKGNADLVKRFPDRRALSWWETTHVEKEGAPKLKVTAIPSNHWGARNLVDQWRRWGGFLLEFPDIPSPHHPSQPLSVCFAGDTANTEKYKKVHSFRKEAPIDVAIMPIGAYDPWSVNHCTPEEAWRMGIDDLKSTHFLPIHYGTFPISAEPIEEPMQRLLAFAEEHGCADKIVAAQHGATFSLPLK
ncbi:MAG TPA: hypothetical protein DCE42_17835 [Myxococcales bacterium]|nr:hypothetical protein [Deltaproteobacteria bacterium]MBU53050.1 hypothetical protein [Deltaproteobacteria bacterium]HAA56630.1 hypothetical protein [Myxococcales bacterium]|tara:strand:- start:7290 stop:8117 length:828 start_codon:yes stop_codon:yes gene_type:complete